MSKLLQYFGVSVKQGTVLFKEGDQADYLYMIHRGKVQISRTVRNEEEILQVLGDGEFVGEMAVIDSMPRSANAIALEECELIRMDKKSFDTTIEENNNFAVNFITFLSKRIRFTNDLIKILTEKNMTYQFFIEVLKEFFRSGKKDASNNWMLIPLNEFIETFKKMHKGNEDRFWSILDELMSNKTLVLKKYKNDVSFLAIDIS